MDNKLTFSQHTTEISKSMNRTLHTIRLLRPSITTELAKTLITALILPRLDYCNFILHKSNKNTIIPLNILLYSAARTIYRIPKYSRTHITPYLKSLHWLPITQRIQYKILLMIHHATYYNNPDYLTDLLNEHNPSKPQRTIYKYKLFIQNSRNLTRKQETAFSLAAPKLWNSLPYDIRSISSTPIFKSRLKTHLFNMAYTN